MTRYLKAWLLVVLGATLGLGGAVWAQDQEKVHFDRVGRVNFTIKSAAAGIGYSWGKDG